MSKKFPALLINCVSILHGQTLHWPVKINFFTLVILKFDAQITELDLFFMLNVWKRGNRSHSSRGWRAAAVQGWTLFCLNIVLLEKCRFRSVKIWLWTDVNKWFVSNRHFWLKAKIVSLLFPQGECFTKIFTLTFWNRRTKKTNLKTTWHFIWLKWLMRGNGRGE